MACGCAHSSTPLAEYARSLRTLDDGEGLSMFFPLYTVPLGIFLDMTKIEPHEALKARNVLVEFQRNMGNAAFVSHQWMATNHPDPDCKQIRVLQDALKNMMGSLKNIPVDLISEGQNINYKPLPTTKILSEPLFFWYDYFSCPQQQGLCEAAINSIPAYVHECSFFFALVPALENRSETNLITPFTWNSRGWCRLERSCRELSQNQSWIQVKGPTDLQLILGAIASIRAGSGPVGEGAFTVPEDCLKLGPVLMKALKRKLLWLLKAQDLPGFRFLLNQQGFLFRGLDCNPFEPVPGFENNQVDLDVSPLVAKFFYQNGFRSIWGVDSAGFSPLHYAALNGDPSLVQGLLMLQADPNRGTKKAHPGLGFEPGVLPLSICCTFKNNEAVQVLISARGKVTSSALVHRPLQCATMVNNAEAVCILLRAKCRPEQNSFGFTPLDTAASTGSLEALDELLTNTKVSALDATHALHSAAAGSGGAQVVQRLVEMRADVNAPIEDIYKRTLLMRVLYALKVLQHRFHKVTILSEVLYQAKGGTPLMIALVLGEYDLAAALIAAGAELNLQNARGLTAADLIRMGWGPEFLLEAVEGQIQPCQRVSLLACGCTEVQF